MNATPLLHALPVFPLDDYFVFPGTVTPLHVFETRYRQMMRDLMDASGRFVMAPTDPALLRDPRAGAGPELPPLGTLVELLRTEELEDGRWLVLLVAIARVTLAEVPSDRLYRKADARVIAETESADESGALREALVAGLGRTSEGISVEMPETAPIGRLADLLLHTLKLDAQQRRRAYGELDPAERARLALEWLTPA